MNETQIQTQANVRAIYNVLRKANLLVGSEGSNGQIRGLSEYSEGFMGEYGGTTEYRCARCHQRMHTVACLQNRGRRPSWKQRLVKDGSVILSYHLRTFGRRGEDELPRREQSILKAIEVLQENGYKVEKTEQGRLKVTK